MKWSRKGLIHSLTNINELEDLAMEAAKCPQEHLIKHFMLQPCTMHHQKMMKPFLLLPIKEFKFKLAMLLQEDYSMSNFSNVVIDESILEEEKEPHFTQSFNNQKTPPSAESIIKSPKQHHRGMRATKTQNVMFSGKFCCKGCNRIWVSHKLISADGESTSLLKRQCYTCKVQVSPQDIQIVNRVCFECGQHGHLARQCPDKPRFNRRACYGCGQLGHLVQDCQSGYTKIREDWQNLGGEKLCVYHRGMWNVNGEKLIGKREC